MKYEANFERLEELVAERLPADSVDLIQRAYGVAEAAHEAQMRDEGTPYIIHPVRVALTLVDEVQTYSPTLICSALLHDVIEDSPITRQDIDRQFGPEIAEIVWLLTKFEEVTLADYLAEIERASATGAPLVKLCDRLDNLRFLAHSHRLEKKHRYIRTTETYYLPLAARTNQYLHREILRALDEAREHVAKLTV
jgi:GTP pyrophosphokinase